MPTVIEDRLRDAEARARTAENILTAAVVLREAQIPASSPESHRLFNQLVKLPDASAMRAHIAASQGGARGLREATSYTPAARKLLAQEGAARPDGSYPITSKSELEDALDDFNRSGGSDADREHITARADALGATDCLPADWPGSTCAVPVQESERRLNALGIPTLDGGTLGPVRLREATAGDLQRLGIPTIAVPGGRVPELEQLGIPTIGGGALGPIPLRESEAGTGTLQHMQFSTDPSGGAVMRRLT